MIIGIGLRVGGDLMDLSSKFALLIFFFLLDLIFATQFSFFCFPFFSVGYFVLVSVVYWRWAKKR